MTQEQLDRRDLGYRMLDFCKKIGGFGINTTHYTDPTTFGECISIETRLGKLIFREKDFEPGRMDNDSAVEIVTTKLAEVLLPWSKS